MNETRDNMSPRPALAGAVGSLLLGLASVLLLLQALAGLPAMLLGLVSIRRLNAVAGRTPDAPRHAWGRRFAATGMVLGATGTLFSIVAFGSLLLLKATEASRRAECMDNLRAIGGAVELYHQFNNNSYPKAVVDEPMGVSMRPEKRLSWLVEMLPYLEGPTQENGGQKRSARDRRLHQLNQLHDRFNPGLPWDVDPNAEAAATTVKRYVCPSHPRTADYERPGLNFYPGIAGVGPDAPLLPLEDPRAGILGYRRQVQVDWKNRTDPLKAGLAHTLLCAETMVHNGPWAAGGSPTLRSLNPTEGPYIGYNRPFGGLHPGGANLLMLDGSVRFFTDRGSPQVLEDMATIGGAQP